MNSFKKYSRNKLLLSGERVARSIVAASLILISLSTISCMHLNAERYLNGKPDGEGFKFYEAKPYLKVTSSTTTKEGATTKTQTAEIIYLPDYTRYTTVKVAGTFGTADLGFDLTGSMLTKFNSKIDTKTPETITALSGLLTAAAGVAFSGPSPGAPIPDGIYRIDVANDGTISFEPVEFKQLP